MKVCKGCSAELDYSMFYRHKRHSDGYNSRCKICHKQTAHTGEKKSTYDKERRAANLERLRNYDKQRASNPNRRALHNEETRRRRAILREAIPKDYDKEGVLAMYRLSQKLSRITGVVMHVDHIVPLAHGGEHNTRNLQLLAGSLNIAKGANPHWQLPHAQYPKDKRK